MTSSKSAILSVLLLFVCTRKTKKHKTVLSVDYQEKKIVPLARHLGLFKRTFSQVLRRRYQYCWILFPGISGCFWVLENKNSSGMLHSNFLYCPFLLPNASQWPATARPNRLTASPGILRSSCQPLCFPQGAASWERCSLPKGKVPEIQYTNIPRCHMSPSYITPGGLPLISKVMYIHKKSTRQLV